MTRTMYVLQNPIDGKFYWKKEGSSFHGIDGTFDEAFLFKTKQGAESRRRIPKYSKCVVKEVIIKLV